MTDISKPVLRLAPPTRIVCANTFGGVTPAMPETISVTIEMTEEEARSLAYVTSADHPGRRSLERKLRRFAEQHPAIRAEAQRRQQERVEAHDADIYRTASTGLYKAACACGWQSRSYRDPAKADAALETHRSRS